VLSTKPQNSYTSRVKLQIIANPKAGHGRGLENIERLKRLLRLQALDYEILETTAAGEATEIARDLAKKERDRIIVLGGDGTISEVVNGVLGTTIELGMICVGTGNDIARSLGIPYNNLKASLGVILAGRTKMVDIGMEVDRCFVSALGIGLAANIAARVNKMKTLKGPTSFFVAAYQATVALESLPLCLTLDSKKMEVECVAVLIQNSCYCGGGLLLAPQASMTDGLLDVVVVEKISRTELMFNFPRIYQGKHLGHPKFRIYQAKNISIESLTKVDKMFDGDLFGKTPVRARIAESSVRMVV